MRTYSANFFGHGSSRFDARPPRQRSLNGNRQVASEHRQHLLRVTNREAAHDANVCDARIDANMAALVAPELPDQLVE